MGDSDNETWKMHSDSHAMVLQLNLKMKELIFCFLKLPFNSADQVHKTDRSGIRHEKVAGGGYRNIFLINISKP